MRAIRTKTSARGLGVARSLPRREALSQAFRFAFAVLRKGRWAPPLGLTAFLLLPTSSGANFLGSCRDSG
jgi:hypothetical protein